MVCQDRVLSPKSKCFTRDPGDDTNSPTRSVNVDFYNSNNTTYFKLPVSRGLSHYISDKTGEIVHLGASSYKINK